MDENKKMEIAILLNELYLKSEDDFYLIESKIREVIEEPN